MKKFYLGIALILMAATLATAQTASGQGTGPVGPGRGMMWAANQQAPVAPKAVHLEGKLAFVDDQPVLQTKDGSYLVHMPRFYYYAYTEGFKAGDAMKLDGYVLTAPAAADVSQGSTPQAASQATAQQVLFVTKAVVGSKTYDFSAAYGRGGMMGGRGFGGRGGMMGRGGFGQGNRGGCW
jgi:hypothetical protein